MEPDYRNESDEWQQLLANDAAYEQWALELELKHQQQREQDEQITRQPGL